MSIKANTIPSIASLKRQQGASLLETLIAGFVFAIGVLTVAGLQLQGLSTLSNSSSINAAMIGASDMADRMRANAIALSSGAYDNINAANVVDPDCGNNCSDSEMAQLDAFSVFAQLQSLLPQSSMQISNAGSGIFTVDIQWLERNGAEQGTMRHRISFRPYTP